MDSRLPRSPCELPPVDHLHTPGWHLWSSCLLWNSQRQLWHFPGSRSTGDTTSLTLYLINSKPLDWVGSLTTVKYDPSIYSLNSEFRVGENTTNLTNIKHLKLSYSWRERKYLSERSVIFKERESESDICEDETIISLVVWLAVWSV